MNTEFAFSGKTVLIRLAGLGLPIVSKVFYPINRRIAVDHFCLLSILTAAGTDQILHGSPQPFQSAGLVGAIRRLDFGNPLPGTLPRRRPIAVLRCFLRQ